jgi:hypothetical protein
MVCLLSTARLRFISARSTTRRQLSHGADLKQIIPICVPLSMSTRALRTAQIGGYARGLSSEMAALRVLRRSSA